MRRSLIAFLASMTVVAGAASPASTEVSGVATLTLSPDVGHIRLPITAQGTGFEPGETVDLTFDGARLGNAAVRGDGSFHARARVPGTALPGDHEVVAVGESSGLSASANFLVRMDWERFLLDGANRWNRFENVLNPGNVGQLEMLWSREVGNCFGFGCSVVVAGGILYAAEIRSVWALDASTGDVVWSVPTADTVILDPIVADGMVFVGLQSGEVLSLDAATGETVWSVVVGDLEGNELELAADADRLYVPGYRGDLFALDLHDGTAAWQAHVASSSACGAAVWNGIVYSGGEQSVALDAITGATIWTADAPCVGQSAVYSSGRVFAGPSAGGRVTALDALTGEVLWAADLDHAYAVVTSPVAADGELYVPTSDLGWFYALDARTGSVLWGRQDSFLWPSAPSVANGVVYEGNDTGRIKALDPATGDELWGEHFGVTTFGGPIVADGRLYVSNGTVMAFGLPGE